MFLFKIFSRFWICWQINLKQFESKVIPLFVKVFVSEKKIRNKISSLLHLTSFFRLEIFQQICTFCSGIPCPKIAFLFLTKLRVVTCMLAKSSFPSKMSTSRFCLKASNFSTMTFKMCTISYYPKKPLIKSKVKKLSWWMFI